MKTTKRSLKPHNYIYTNSKVEKHFFNTICAKSKVMIKNRKKTTFINLNFSYNVYIYLCFDHETCIFFVYIYISQKEYQLMIFTSNKNISLYKDSFYLWLWYKFIQICAEHSCFSPWGLGAQQTYRTVKVLLFMTLV